MKKCPYCAEKIQDKAIVCRYCGRDLPKFDNKVVITTDEKEPTKSCLSVFVERIIIRLAILFVVGAVIYGVSSNNSSTQTSISPTRTPVPTVVPTKTQPPFFQTLIASSKTQEAVSNPGCINANDIDASYRGENVCVFGIVTGAGNTNIGDNGQFRIYFGGGFFLLDVNYEYPEVKVGDCVSVHQGWWRPL